MVHESQIASINACAEYFAKANYQVETSFYKVGFSCTIFFDELEKRQSIIKRMRCFADDCDGIRFFEHQLGDRKFYVLKLEKVALL